MVLQRVIFLVFARQSFLVRVSKFIGFNFHWNEYRRYSWSEIVSNLYEIKAEELNSMEQYPIAKFVRNR